MKNKPEFFCGIAALIVTAYRVGAPMDFDPQNFSPDMPSARNGGTESAQALKWKTKNAGALYEAEARYQPLYQRLALGNTDTFLNGSEGGTYTVNEQVPNPRYKGKNPATGSSFMPGFGGGLPGISGSFGGIPGLGGGGGGGGGLPGLPGLPGIPGLGGDGGGDFFGGLFGGGDDKKKKIPKKIWQSREVSYGPQRGFLDMLENDINPALLRLDTAQRESDIGDIATLGPKAREALRLANPDNAALLDQLNEQANSELALGAQLDPSMRREVEQGVRAGQSARGMGFGNSDLFEELMATGSRGEAMRDKRRGFASQLLGLNQAIYGDPFQQILGRPSGAGAASGIFGQASGLQAGPSLFNPESSYMQDLFNTNLNMKASGAISSANNKNAILAAGISALGGAAGGALGMI